jgi:hypothetical protein
VSGLNLATPDARHRRPLKFLYTILRKRRNEVLEKMLERHRSADHHSRPQAFFDVGHPLEYQSKNRRKLDGKFMAVYLRIDAVLMKRLSL